MHHLQYYGLIEYTQYIEGHLYTQFFYKKSRERVEAQIS